MLYVYGELDTTATKAVENHLEICEACRYEAERLLRLLGKLRDSAALPELSAEEVKSLVTNIKRKLNNKHGETWWRRYLDYGPSRMIPAIATACVLIFTAGIIGYVKLSETNEFQLFSRQQKEELILSNGDLELLKNLDFLKELDAIQKLSRVVDLDNDNQSQGEINGNTRGMRLNGYRKVYV
jgi:hypothetical protein